MWNVHRISCFGLDVKRAGSGYLTSAHGRGGLAGGSKLIAGGQSRIIFLARGFEREEAMPKAKQITVWIENSPGQLAQVAKALAKAKVNCSALAAYPAGRESPVRMLAASPAKARKALEALGVRVTEEDVLRLTLPDRPGQLAAVVERLAQASVNVDYAYATTAGAGKKAGLVLAVSDVVGAMKALRGI
jgi:hypothetical protein